MTTTNAIEQARQFIGSYKGELIAALPTHLKEKGVGWMTAALGALRRDPNLLQCANRDPGSLIVALSQAAQLGLMPGTEEFWLTPRGGKILGIIGYVGYVEMMYRAGAVSSVIVEAVHENDKFSYVPGRDDRPIHEVDWMAPTRGRIVLAYAYAIMKDGAVSKVVIVNQSRIDRAKDASSTAGKSHSPWESDEVKMWMKTAARDLSKWVPTSAEYRDRLNHAEAIETPAPPLADGTEDKPVRVDQATGEVEDAAGDDSTLEDMGEADPAYPAEWGVPGD